MATMRNSGEQILFNLNKALVITADSAIADLKAENENLLAQCESLSKEVERLRTIGLVQLEEAIEDCRRIIALSPWISQDSARRRIDKCYNYRKTEWEK